MDAAEGGPNSRVLFDKSDAATKIVATKDDVIERRREFICFPENVRREGGSSGNRKKSSAGKRH